MPDVRPETAVDRTPRSRAATDVLISGRAYVLLLRSEFDLLCAKALRLRGDAGKLGAGPVGPDLRARRRRAGLTLSEVARRAGIRAETLSRIEHSHTDPSVGTVQSVLRALGTGA